MKTEPNSPANPCTAYETDKDYPQLDHRVYYNGLTKRETFAAMAMQGILANESRGSAKLEDISKSAVNLAEALINELNKTES